LAVAALTLTLVGLLGSNPGRAATGDPVHQVDMFDPIEQSTPALGPDGQIYVGDTHGFVLAYNPQTRRAWLWDQMAICMYQPAPATTARWWPLTRKPVGSCGVT